MTGPPGVNRKGHQFVRTAGRIARGIRVFRFNFTASYGHEL